MGERRKVLLWVGVTLQASDSRKNLVALRYEPISRIPGWWAVLPDWVDFPPNWATFNHVRACSHLAFFFNLPALVLHYIPMEQSVSGKSHERFIKRLSQRFFSAIRSVEKSSTFRKKAADVRRLLGNWPITSGTWTQLSTVKTRNNDGQITRESAVGAIDSFNYRTCRDLQHVLWALAWIHSRRVTSGLEWVRCERKNALSAFRK